MDDELICNYKDCRKRLKTFAWVTSCSHVFCETDGSREFEKQQVCPACDTTLTGQYDIVKSELKPSEEYKSMILAGQRPEIIMEVCSRAMSFWTYQTHLERAYQEYRATKATEKAKQQESYYEHMLAVNQSEAASLKTQLVCINKELEALKSKHSEASEKLLEKTRQYQKLQGMYEALRRRNVTPASFEGEGERVTPRRMALRQFEIPLGSIPDKEAFVPRGLNKKQAQGPAAPLFTADHKNHAPKQQHHGKKGRGHVQESYFMVHHQNTPGGSLF
ncbi:E3 ubiquitin-protein ligase CCNB1IP1-like [Halichondria panicea]|uniref:E3 ubiquitin-protein ligase CCNB1IP1-like n=1 Tax=Halichondria panicea TaxID=6063 RepID=UPI00312B9271